MFKPVDDLRNKLITQMSCENIITPDKLSIVIQQRLKYGVCCDDLINQFYVNKFLCRYAIGHKDDFDRGYIDRCNIRTIFYDQVEQIVDQYKFDGSTIQCDYGEIPILFYK